MTLIDCFRAVYKTLRFITFINVSPFGFHGENPPGSPHTVMVVQLPSRVQLFVTPWTATLQEPPSFTISQSLLKLKSIESTIPSNHLTICHPLSSCPQSSPASGFFPMSQLFASGGQSTGASASASVLPKNIQD